jgi:hypothetical protein
LIGTGAELRREGESLPPGFPARNADRVVGLAFGGLTMVGTTLDLEGELGRWLNRPSQLISF